MSAATDDELRAAAARCAELMPTFLYRWCRCTHKSGASYMRFDVGRHMGICLWRPEDGNWRARWSAHVAGSQQKGDTYIHESSPSRVVAAALLQAAEFAAAHGHAGVAP